MVSLPLLFSTRCLVSSRERFSVVIPLIWWKGANQVNGSTFHGSGASVHLQNEVSFLQSSFLGRQPSFCHVLDENLTAQLESVLWRRETSVRSLPPPPPRCLTSAPPQLLPSLIFFFLSVVLMGCWETSWLGSLLYPVDISGSVFPCPLRSGVLLRVRACWGRASGLSLPSE